MFFSSKSEFLEFYLKYPIVNQPLESSDTQEIDANLIQASIIERRSTLFIVLIHVLIKKWRFKTQNSRATVNLALKEFPSGSWSIIGSHENNSHVFVTLRKYELHVHTIYIILYCINHKYHLLCKKLLW